MKETTGFAVDDVNLDDVPLLLCTTILLSISFIIVEDFSITERKQITVIMYADMHIALVKGIDMEPFYSLQFMLFDMLYFNSTDWNVCMNS